MTHPWAEHQCQKGGQVEQIHGGAGRSISHFLLGSHAPNIICRFLRHIGTFLDLLRGVDTPPGTVPVPNTWAKLSKDMGQGESISQFLLRPHAPNIFWMFLKDIETFLDHLLGIDTPVGRVPALKTGLS